jgi:hypothetical protein
MSYTAREMNWARDLFLGAPPRAICISSRRTNNNTSWHCTDGAEFESCRDALDHQEVLVAAGSAL